MLAKSVAAAGRKKFFLAAQVGSGTGVVRFEVVKTVPKPCPFRVHFVSLSCPNSWFGRGRDEDVELEDTRHEGDGTCRRGAGAGRCAREGNGGRPHIVPPFVKSRFAPAVLAPRGTRYRYN